MSCDCQGSDQRIRQIAAFYNVPPSAFDLRWLGLRRRLTNLSQLRVYTVCGGVAAFNVRCLLTAAEVNVKKVVLFTASEENVRDGDSWIGVLIPDPKECFFSQLGLRIYITYHYMFRTAREAD